MRWKGERNDVVLASKQDFPATISKKRFEDRPREQQRQKKAGVLSWQEDSSNRLYPP